MTNANIGRWFWAIAIVMSLAFAGASTLACTCDDPDDDDDDSGVDDDVDDDTDDDNDDDVDDDADDDSADDDSGAWVVPPANNPAPPWPEWVLRHWVWEDESDQDSALENAQTYLDNDIPVGAVIIDSPWETGYNTFDFDTAKFPDAQAMIDDFHDLDVRVFMWITPNVNTDSPNFQEGLDAGYYVKGGATLEWWKGDGAFIDYWNPDAVDWWHGLMDNVLDMGIDGWKTDGSEFSLYLWLFVPTADGPKLVTEYQEAYYRDFFEYTRERLGNDRVITARPVDSYGIPWGPSFAPRDVNFAGWVGDQDPTFEGLRAAMLNMFMSGNRAYVNFGSDISGYRGDDQRDKDLYIRWTQFGAFSPIMENGGTGVNRPWLYDQEVLDIYRAFTLIHHELIPYNYSEGAWAYAAHRSNFTPYKRREWTYFLGRDIFVAPMYEPGAQRTITFPEGTWIHWFTQAEYAGGVEDTLTVPLNELPVFVRQGAIVPTSPPVGGLYGDASDEVLVRIYPGAEGGEYRLFEEGGAGADVSYEVNSTGLRVSISATTRPYALRVYGNFEDEPVTVDPTGALSEAADYDALAAADTGYVYDHDAYALFIKPGSAADGLVVEIGAP